MEISDLKIFIAVARQGSISKGAKELHYVQSNVTARIKQLEEGLGTILFHRKSRGVALTTSGHLLLDYAQRIIRLSKEAEDVICHQSEPIGRLLIGSMETTAAVRLPPLLTNYHRLYPQVELNLVTGSSQELLKRLLNYEIDGALVAGDISQEVLLAEKAYEEELVLITAGDIKELDQLANFKILVLRTDCACRGQLEKWLHSTGRLPYQIVELGSIEGIIGCVAAGMGVGFMPRPVVEKAHIQKICSLHFLPDHFGTMTTWFVRRRTDNTSKAMQAFRDLIVKQIN
ncbi:MAG: LysR substrate-binding domain-containing protein [Desulfobulbaceae bacterium]|nr:LysR substrate-binding domain-containing protein [Desulfobulbaceae bacterium]